MHVVVVWLAAVAQAGTWVREPGHGYAQLSAGLTVAGDRFTEAGRRLPMTDPHFVPENFEQVFDAARFTQLEGQLYAELGLVSGLEVHGALPVRRVVSRWDFAQGDDVLRLTHAAFGDAVIGLRAGGAVGRAVIAGGVATRWPLYDNAPEVLGIEAGNADIYDDRPPVGPGTVDLDLTAAIGTGWARGWVQGEAGVRLRNRRFGAQLPLRVQAGLRPVPIVAAFGEIEVVAALTDGQAPDDYLDEYNKGPLALDRQTHVRPGLGVLVEPRSAGRSGGPGALVRVDAIVLGRRTSATTTLSVGATWTW